MRHLFLILLLASTGCRVIAPEIQTTAAVQSAAMPPEGVPLLLNHKMVRSGDQLVFRARLDGDYTGSGTEVWYLGLLIDADSDPSTGVDGFEYVVSQAYRPYPAFVTTRMDCCGQPWVQTGFCRSREFGRTIEVRIPLAQLGGDEGIVNYGAGIASGNYGLLYSGKSVRDDWQDFDEEFTDDAPVLVAIDDLPFLED